MENKTKNIFIVVILGIAAAITTASTVYQQKKYNDNVVTIFSAMEEKLSKEIEKESLKGGDDE